MISLKPDAVAPGEMGTSVRKILFARLILYSLAIGAVVILADFVVELRDSVTEQATADIRAEAAVFTQDVRNLVAATIDDVSSVGALFESSALVSEQEFFRFVSRSNLLRGQQKVHSIMVMPLIDGEHLPKFLAALDARKDVRATMGYEDSLIEIVEGRDLYAPAIYVESMADRSELLGYDLATSPERMQVARSALLAFQPHMTPPTQIRPDAEGTPESIMIIGAVKSEGNIGMRNYLPEDAERSLLIAAIFTPKIVIAEMMRLHGKTRFTLRITDQTDEQIHPVFETATPFDPATRVQEEKIVLGNRVWVLEYGVLGLMMSNRAIDRFIVLGLIGAIAILALAIALDRLLRIRGHLEQTVHERTLELEDANEALTEAAQKASAESEAKSMFLAHMSHELRTPLNAVIGYGQMLQSEIYGRLGDDRYKDYAKTIVDAGSIQLSLVEDLLALSALESEGRNLRKTDIDLDSLIQRCVDLVQTKADQENITVTVETQAGGATLSSDERAVQQILTNLLSNAVKYTDPGGAVVLRVEKDRASRTIITVEDTGIGIPEEQLDKVLQPFNRAHEDSYKTHEGVGLGLSIVRGLVDACGAEIQISSTPDVGTTVRVTFPAISKLAGRPGKTGTVETQAL